MKKFNLLVIGGIFFADRTVETSDGILKLEMPIEFQVPFGTKVSECNYYTKNRTKKCLIEQNIEFATWAQLEIQENLRLQKIEIVRCLVCQWVNIASLDWDSFLCRGCGERVDTSSCDDLIKE
jgi:hypothetical protein